MPDPNADDDAPGRWPAERTMVWSAARASPLGANYIPANAVNQLEMWQAATFDPTTIDRELGWAAGLGMNTMRVFLHDLLWVDDAAGLLARMDHFLAIADGHGIATMFVLFDGCWDPAPRLGPQPPPVPGVHNSRWVQSPGTAALADPAQYERLRAYVEGIVAAFAHDRRVVAWDIWNEPDSPGGLGYPVEPGKAERVALLLPAAFAWARGQNPDQPLTSALWRVGDWGAAALDTVRRIQLANSDILSFHDYRDATGFEASTHQLLLLGRPVWATEYLARPAGSTFEAILPVARRLGVGAFNWGFVDGRTQTRLPWDSWNHPYVGREPDEWYHDVLRADGAPYRETEAALIRKLAPR